MFSDFLEKLSDLFTDGGNDGHSDIVSGLEHSGIDLSMYDADEIRNALNAAMDADGMDVYSSNYGHDIAFGAAPDVDARNLAKSSLITELSTNHIYTGNLTTDGSWGGLDSYSGEKVYNAINDARDNNRITDSVFNDLIALLKKACHYQ